MKMFKNIKIKYLFMFIFLFIFIGTLFTVFAQSSDECMNTKFLNPKYKNLDDIDKIALNKVVIVGDSRMEFLLDDEDVVKPINFIFDVKSGAGFDWFEETGKPKLEDILNNKDLNYHYHVVFNLGVNDIQYEENVTKTFDDYFKEYQALADKYGDVDFYFLSINPIDEDLLNESQPYNVRTNEDIEKLNDDFKDAILKIDNFKYCDAYNDLEFLTDDGIHYLSKTSQDILNYIARRCVVYK